MKADAEAAREATERSVNFMILDYSKDSREIVASYMNIIEKKESREELKKVKKTSHTTTPP